MKIKKCVFTDYWEKWVLGISGLLLILPLFFTLEKTGAFTKAPSIKINAENKYSETLKVVADIDYMPYSFIDEEGKPQGHSIEIINAVANRLNKNIELKLLNWDDAEKALENGEADLILGIEVEESISTCNYALSNPTIYDEVVIWSRKLLSSQFQLYGKELGILKGDKEKTDCEKIFQCRTVEKETYHELFEACNNGVIDFVLCPKRVGNAISLDNNFNLHPSVLYSTSFMGMAARSENKDLINSINAALTKLNSDGTLKEIYKRWITSYDNHVSIKRVFEEYKNFFIGLLILWAIWIMILFFVNKLLKNRKLLQDRYDIIQSMNHVYFGSFYIDLENDTFMEISSQKNIREIINTAGEAQKNMFITCEKLIVPEYRNVMKEFVDLSTIQERLKDNPSISQEYIGVTSGWSMAYLIAGDRDKNGKLKHIFVAFSTIHEEKALEEKHRREIESINEIIGSAGIGIWAIVLRDDAHPRMLANKKMQELLGIEKLKLSEEDVYSAWYDRIPSESMESVQNSVDEMMRGDFSENTYLWNHPEKGFTYVRCGGTSRKYEDGTCILRGYHYDVNDIIIQEELQRHADEMEKTQNQMNQMNITLLNALGTVVEFRSLESGDHVKRVMTFTKVLLTKLKENYPKYHLSEKQIELMSQAAALHDVGKIAVPDDILKAPRKLTDEEFAEMKKHTIYGCEILEHFKFSEHNEFYKYCYDICRWHHEKVDGKGYPDGLTGNSIPIYCQVTAIADCYDALVSRRVYKDAIPSEAAFQMIKNGECGAFSEEVINSFEQAKDEIFKMY